jgi:hypothetical protein
MPYAVRWTAAGSYFELCARYSIHNICLQMHVQTAGQGGVRPELSIYCIHDVVNFRSQVCRCAKHEFIKLNALYSCLIPNRQVMSLKRELATRGASGGNDTVGATKFAVPPLPSIGAAPAVYQGALPSAGTDIRPLVAVLERIEASLNEALALQKAKQ